MRSANCRISLTPQSLVLSTVLVYAAVMIVIGTRQGLGLVGDSVDYVAAARSIAAGQGVRTLDGNGATTPLTQFPPLYPALLTATAKITHTDPIDAARFVAIASYLLLLALVAWIAYEVSDRSMGASLVACAIAAVSPPLLRISSTLISETPFL